MEEETINSVTELNGVITEKKPRFLSPKMHDRMDQRIRAVVRAAYILLGEHGLEGLTIRAVIEKSRVKRRNLYEYFPEKDDLIIAVFSRSVEMAVEKCREGVSVIENPLDRLKTVIFHIVLGDPTDENRVRSARRAAALTREHMRLSESRSRDILLALKPLLDLLSQQLAEGIAQGLVRNYDPDRLAVLSFNFLTSIVHAELFTDDARTQDRTFRMKLAEEIWDFCLGAISA